MANARFSVWLGAATVLALAVGFIGGHSWQAPTASDTTSEIPRQANGKPDFSGIWQSLSTADHDLEPHHHRVDAPPSAGVIVEGTIPYLPNALEKRQQNYTKRRELDPALKGYTLGIPRVIYYPAPFQLLQRERDLTLLPQFGHSVRTIHTNGTDHPQEPNDWWLGDSRGHWDGDTLVVDVKHFNDETWLDRSGNFHSDALQITERWQFLNANTIEYQATLTDPQVYSKPWTIKVLLYRHLEPNFQLIEDYRYTLDYADYYPYPADKAPNPATLGTTQQGGLQ